MSGPRLPQGWPATAARAGAITLPAGAITLAGPAACIADLLVTAGLAALRVEGRAPSPAALAIAAAIARAAEAAARDTARGHAGAPPRSDPPPSDAPASITVGTVEAARLMGMQPRSARRHAEEAGVRYGHRGAMVWDRSAAVAVAARLDEQRARRHQRTT